MSQPRFATIAGTTKQTLFSWETGKTAPDAFQIAALAQEGVDVLYVVLGERSSAMPARDAAEQVLLDSYRRCSDSARANLIQTSALLAAGVAMSQESPSHQKQAPQVSARNLNMTNLTPGGVQVGAAGGSVTVMKGHRGRK